MGGLTFITEIHDGPLKDDEGIYVIATIREYSQPDCLQSEYEDRLYYDSLEDAYDDIEGVLDGWIQIPDEEVECIDE